MRRGPRLIDGSPRRPASRVLSVRVPEAVGAALDAEAEARGVTQATVVREVLTRETTWDPEDVQPVARYRAPRPRPSLDVVRLAEVREVAGEAVGTARQLAGLDRARGGPALASLDEAIESILSAAAALDAAKAAILAADEVPG